MNLPRNDTQTAHHLSWRFISLISSQATKRLLALGLASIAIIGEPSFAASATWNGTTNGTWATGTNWSTTPVPGTGDTATFSNPGNGNTTLDLGSGVTINIVKFTGVNTGAYTIGAGAVGSQTLTLNNTGQISMDSSISNNELFNANLVLGTGSATVGVNLTNASTNTLTLAGNVSAGTTGAATLYSNASGTTLISGSLTKGTATSLTLSIENGKVILAGASNSIGSITMGTGTTLQLQANSGNTSGGTSTVLGAPTSFGISNNDTIQLRSDSSVTITGGPTTGYGSSNVTIDVDHISTGTGNTITFATGTTNVANTTINYTGADGYSLSTGNYNVNTTGDFLTLNASTANVTMQIINGSYSTLTFEGAANINVAGQIKSSYSAGSTVDIVKTGTGTLTLSGANISTAMQTTGTVISGGTVVANIGMGTLTAGTYASGAFGPTNGTTTGLVTLGDANTTANGSSPTVLIDGAYTVANPITVSSNATTGTYTIGGNNASSTTATYSGAITLNKAVTLMAAAGATTDFSTSSTWTTNNNAFTIGSTGNTGTVELDSSPSTTGGITVTSGARLSVGSGATLTAPLTVTNGSISAVGTSSKITGNVAYNSSLSSTFQGVIGGSSNTLGVSAGLLTLSGSSANTGTGLTTVSGGELDLDKTAGVLSIAGNATVSGGILKLLTSNQIDTGATLTVTSGTLNFGGQSQTVTSVVNSGGTVYYGGSSGTGTVTVSDPTWQAGGTNDVEGLATFTDGLIVTGGTNTVTGGTTGGQGILTLGNGAPPALAFTGSSTPTITINGDATLPGIVRLLGNVTADGASTATIATTSGTDGGELDLDAGNRTFTVSGTTNPGLLVSAQIVDSTSSTGALTKAGTGYMTVTGNNTYGAGTTISGGTLYVNNTSGSGTGTGGVSVSSGGILAGSGTIKPTGGAGVTISNGATLASGSSQTANATANGGSGAVNGNGTGGGLTLDNTEASTSLLKISGGATLTFALGSTTPYNGGSGALNFTNPNTDSTLLDITGSTTDQIFSNTTTPVKVDLVDLTNGSTGVALTLRAQNPYLLIETDPTGAAALAADPANSLDADFSNIWTTGGEGQNGYVLGISTGSGSAYTGFIVAAYDINNNQVNSSTNLENLRLYLYNGDLEVVPEPGTWALMIGGLALLVMIQRRKGKQS